MMDIFALLGYLGICAFSLFQAVRIFYTQQVRGLSISALWALAFGIGMLQVSMVFFGGYAIYAVGNGVSLCCTVAMIGGYYAYRRNG